VVLGVASLRCRHIAQFAQIPVPGCWALAHIPFSNSRSAHCYIRRRSVDCMFRLRFADDLLRCAFRGLALASHSRTVRLGHSFAWHFSSIGNSPSNEISPSRFFRLGRRVFFRDYDWPTMGNSSRSKASGVNATPALTTESSPLLPHEGSVTTSSSYKPFYPSGSSTNSSESSISSSSSDEESLAGSTPIETAPQLLSTAAIAQIILVLLIGVFLRPAQFSLFDFEHILTLHCVAVFVFNADGSLVLATHPVIASEFNALESSSWLFTGFGLAGAATQTTVSEP